MVVHSCPRLVPFSFTLTLLLVKCPSGKNFTQQSEQTIYSVVPSDQPQKLTVVDRHIANEHLSGSPRINQTSHTQSIPGVLQSMLASTRGDGFVPLHGQWIYSALKQRQHRGKTYLCLEHRHVGPEVLCHPVIKVLGAWLQPRQLKAGRAHHLRLYKWGLSRDPVLRWLCVFFWRSDLQMRHGRWPPMDYQAPPTS